mmetsp:Transcript_71159/g.163090  ORF Transcript_71159/g.163090 Transcript_71159/m.163090 type:complete len:285 (-) Transcript_71159:256-1110(-)
MSVYFAPKCRHWNPYTGPRSPSSLCPRPILERNSLEPLPSQMWMSLSLRRLALVAPETNQRSSSATPRQKTRLVVSSGNDSRRLNRSEHPNLEMVPVPVRSPFRTPVAMMSRIRFRYWCSSCSWLPPPDGVAREKVWISYLISFSSLIAFASAGGSRVRCAGRVAGTKASHSNTPCTSVRCTLLSRGICSASAYTAAPPIMKQRATSARASREESAAGRDDAASTPSGSWREAGERERTTLTRPASGRNLAGIESHVLRPMTTAFCRAHAASGASPVSRVTRLK